MAFFSKNLMFMVSKQESVVGTPEWNFSSTFPADADFKTRIYNISLTPNIEYDEDVAKMNIGTHGEFNGIVAKQSCQVSFSVPYQDGFVTDNYLSDYLASCGLVSNTYTTTGVGYRSLKQNDKVTMTMAVFNMELGGATPGATAYLLSGCIGDASLTCENNGMLSWSFTFTGKLVDNYAVTNANIPVIDNDMSAVIARTMLNTTCTVNSISQYISGFTLALGNDVQPIINQAETTGYDNFYIAGRKPRFSINSLMRDQATDDVYGRLLAGADVPISLDFPLVVDSALKIYLPRAYLMPYSLAEREGLSNYELNFICGRNHNGTAAKEALIPDETTMELLEGTRS